MRRRSLWLSFILLFPLSELSAQTNPPKVCVFGEAEGYSALRLGRELSSHKLASGASLAVVAITEKALSTEEERRLADPSAPFVRVLLTGRTAKDRSAEINRLACDYDIKVSSMIDTFGSNSVPQDFQVGLPQTTGLPPPQDGVDPISHVDDSIHYELRKTGSKKVLASASAPPLTVHGRQKQGVLNPYALFANQIVKTLNRST